MERGIGPAHVIRQGDGTFAGVWGPFVLKSAFQPIFAFTRGKLTVAAFEGLVRPFRDGQPLGAAAFLDAVPEADRFGVDGLLRAIHTRNAGAFLPRDALLFVNFDPSVITDRAVADEVLRDIRQVLAQAGIEAGRVVCEMTEQRLSSESGFRHFIEALRRAGFHIAVDDYGAEDSDIERIRAVAPDIVKFDAKWITKLMASGPGVSVLSAMVEAFSAKGIRTVFEGLEEGWQLELAERAGASMVQGYVLHRPELAPTSFATRMPPPSVEASLRAAPQSPAPTPPGPQPPAPRHGRVFGKRAT